MSIEKSLERIADALETIAGKDSGASPSSTAASAAKKATGAKSKAASKSKSAKPKKSSDGPTKDDVRAALKELQKATDAATARQVLADHDAKTLTDLDEDQFQSVIDAAEAGAE